MELRMRLPSSSDSPDVRARKSGATDGAAAAWALEAVVCGCWVLVQRARGTGERCAVLCLGGKRHLLLFQPV